MTPTMTTHRATRRRLTIGLCTFLAPALVFAGSSAINSGANQDALPLRNIQIEVRQVQHGSQERSGIAGGIEMDSRSSSAQQQVLVLNGRSAAIGLRSSRPYRLMQTQFRNGVPILVPGVVLLDTTTGFVATPRWDGSNGVELALQATQAGTASSTGRGLPPPSTGSVSTLLIALGEWVTVAQSDQDSQSSQASWGSQGAQNTQQSYELQVRLTVR